MKARNADPSFGCKITFGKLPGALDPDIDTKIAPGSLDVGSKMAQQVFRSVLGSILEGQETLETRPRLPKIASC